MPKMLHLKLLSAQEKNKIMTALTLSDPSMPTFFKKEVLELLDGKVDYLFCNEEEGQILTGEKNRDKLLEKLLSFSNNIVMTLGSEGALYANSNGTITENALSVDAIDTLGAGDSFAGGFLYGIEKGLEINVCLKLAVNLSGTLVTKKGLRLTNSEILDIKKKLHII